MISSLSNFLKYFASLRKRTITFAEALPSEHIDWSPGKGEYTCGDIIRHIGTVQLIHWGVFVGGNWNYSGHGRELGANKSEALVYLEGCNQRALALLQDLPDTSLYEKRANLEDIPISAWRYLMVSIEHEVHHRSQLASYFYQIGLEPPQLFGVYMEDLPRPNEE